MNLNPSTRALGMSSRRAFTLIEVLVGMVVVTISFFALYSGITYGFAVTKAARENLRATQIMLETFEVVRLYTWDQMTNTGFVPSSISATYNVNTNNDTSISAGGATNASGIVYNGTVTVGPADFVNASYSSDLRLVTLSLNWQSGGVLRTQSMSTLVAKQGLQNYVY